MWNPWELVRLRQERKFKSNTKVWQKFRVPFHVLLPNTVCLQIWTDDTADSFLFRNILMYIWSLVAVLTSSLFSPVEVSCKTWQVLFLIHLVDLVDLLLLTWSFESFQQHNGSFAARWRTSRGIETHSWRVNNIFNLVQRPKCVTKKALIGHLKSLDTNFWCWRRENPMRTAALIFHQKLFEWQN